MNIKMNCWNKVKTRTHTHVCFFFKLIIAIIWMYYVSTYYHEGKYIIFSSENGLLIHS